MQMKKLAIFAALMVVAAGVAFASTLNVPFFLDTSTNHATGIAGFIGLKEISGAPRTITVIYTGLNTSGNPTTQQVTFALGANGNISWAPVQSNPVEDLGSIVPNMNIIGPGSVKDTSGSAEIRSAGGLAGRYQQINFSRLTEFAHTILPTVL